MRLFALLSLVRWYNILAITIGLYLSACYLLNPNVSKWLVLTDYKVHLNIAALAMLLMAGYIINAFYDFEKDLINKPRETLFIRLVNKRESLNLYTVFNFIAIILSFYVGWKVFFFNFSLAVILWMYSHKLRKLAVVGELSAATLTVAPFFSLGLYYWSVNYTVVLYVGFIFVNTLNRELIKKMTYYKGDLIYDFSSIPIKYGIRKAKLVLAFLMITSLVPVILLSPFVSDQYIAYYFIFSSLMILISLFCLQNASKAKDFERINTLYKIILITAILSIPLV
ncbi:MAG: geranylgeranylglycerol-phosphate geranylgeranyltransferase [Flavobacteriales bacterium]